LVVVVTGPPVVVVEATAIVVGGDSIGSDRLRRAAAVIMTTAEALHPRTLRPRRDGRCGGSIVSGTYVPLRGLFAVYGEAVLWR